MSLEPAVGRLLVAAPSLFDQNFHQTVILLCNVDPESGAVGLVINRPTAVEVGKVLPLADGRVEPLWIGGPVDGQSLWAVHRRPDLGASHVELMDGVWFGAESELIRRLLATSAEDPGGEIFRLFAGYSGWGPGQLEEELEAGAWTVVPAGPAALFEGTPGRLWDDMLLRSHLPCSREPHSIRRAWLN